LALFGGGPGSKLRHFPISSIIGTDRAIEQSERSKPAAILELINIHGLSWTSGLDDVHDEPSIGCPAASQIKELQEKKKRMEARVRIELTRKGFADLSLTTWVPRRRPKLALSGQKVHSGQPACPQMEKSPRGWAFQDIWSGRRGSNPRHRPWQGRALPLSYSRSSPHSTALPSARQFYCTRTSPPLGRRSPKQSPHASCVDCSEGF
jgi:hypothetical protein